MIFRLIRENADVFTGLHGQQVVNIQLFKIFVLDFRPVFGENVNELGFERHQAFRNGKSDRR